MSYSSEVLADSPLAYYRLEETPDIFPSQTGGGGARNVSSVTEQVVGPLTGGYGVTLNGSNYVSTDYNINASVFTIEAWIKTTDTQGAIIDNRGSGGKSLSLALGPAPVSGGGSGKLWLGLTADGQGAGIATDATFNDGNWHHVVGVWSGTSGVTFSSTQLTLYVDGSVAATTATGTYNPSAAPLVGTGGYRFGVAIVGHGIGSYEGSLSRVALYSGVALSSGRVAAHYAQTTADGYDAEVLADSPTAFWRLHEAPARADDSSGNSRHGTFGNAPASVAGLLVGDSSSAMDFDGVNQFVGVASGAWMNPANLTIEALTRHDAFDSTRVIAARDQSAAGPWRLRTNGNKVELLLWTASSGLTILASTSTLSTGTTYHLAATYDGAMMRIYIDGVLDASVAKTGAAASIAVPFEIARSGFGEYFNGVVDEVAFYGSALSAERIAAHHAAAIGSASPVTIAGEAFASAATALDGAPLLPISVAGEAFASATPALDGTAVVAEPDPPVVVAGEAFFSTATALDGSIPDLPVGEDTSNAFAGRSRGGLDVVTVLAPVGAVPADAPHRVDKALAYPTPTLVDGRPL